MTVERAAASSSDEAEEAAAGEVQPKIIDILQPRTALQAGAHVAGLPYKVRRRVKALKKLQLDATELEAKFYEEVYALERKFHELHSPLYVQRAAVTDGKHEPTDQEAAFALADTDSEDEERITEVNDDGSKKDVVADTSGIPSFWLTIFQTEELLVEIIGEDDEPLLEKLWDIGLAFDQGDNMGFTLSFHFHPNEYFTDSVLTKHYAMKCKPEKDDPFGFEGPEIFKCDGCKINWKDGKNVTVKQIKKKVKKGKDKGKTVTKEVKADSFFNFFSPPAVPDDPEAELEEEVEMNLQQDFQIGHFLRERVVPRAVLFYTGEEQEDEEEDFEDEEDSEDDSDGDDSEEDRPKLKARKGKGKVATVGEDGAAPECKQQ